MTTLLNKWESFYLLLFRFKSAPQKNCHFFLLYKTPVNKSESFKARSKAAEISGEAKFNHEWYILHTTIIPPLSPPRSPSPNQKSMINPNSTKPKTRHIFMIERGRGGRNSSILSIFARCYIVTFISRCTNAEKVIWRSNYFTGLRNRYVSFRARNKLIFNSKFVYCCCTKYAQGP